MSDALRLMAILLLLATLDLTASICLKESAMRREPALAIAGMGIFVLLGAVVYYALEAAEMTVVQLGWTVVLQVLVVAVDAYRYRVVPGTLQAVALVVAVIAMIVVTLAPTRTIKTEPERVIPAQRGPSLAERLEQHLQERRMSETAPMPTLGPRHRWPQS